jgi:phage replication O-like protein O
MTRTPQLEDGYVRIANELLEAILGFDLSHREQSVVLTIIRKTYGYGKKEDDISAAQIGTMCGIARQHVTSTLNALALRNVITKRPGRFGTIIGIQKDHRKWVSVEQMAPASPGLGRGSPEKGLVPKQDTTSPGLGQVDSPESGHTKDNLPKDNLQKTGPTALRVDPLQSIPTGTLVNLYHELMPNNPRVKVINPGRKSAIRARWLEAAKLDFEPFGYTTLEGGLEAWRQFFAVCAESKFLTGLSPPAPGKPAFVADIDFLFSPSGFAKTLENKYHRDAP